MKKKIVGIVVGVIAIAVLLAGGLLFLKGNDAEVDIKNILEVSWYDEEKSEFVITTLEQLEEFADLSDFYNFKDQTIKLGADIVVNEGNAEDWAENAPEKRWKPISGFAGVFDGQGHTISGVYGRGHDTGMALFTNTKRECEIKDLKLVNSYFKTTGEGGTASFSSKGAGTFSRLYSNAIIDCNGENTGGIIAILNAQSSVEECWFEGVINTTNRDCGGIVAEIIGTRASVKHCLFSGTINNTYSYGGARTGGLIGHVDAASTLTFNDCLSSGRMNVDKVVFTGSAIGATYSGGTLNCADIYVSEETYGGALGLSSNGNFAGGFVKWQERRLTGTSAYEWTTLDFDEYWALVADGTPILKYFATETPSVAGLTKKFDTSWYDMSKTTFVLDSREDFYGFYLMSLTDSFKGKTVQLGADIVLNEGKASEWGEKIPENEWRPIGDRFNPFRGTFNGQGHTISGLYIVEKDGSQVYTGLFGVTGQEATVQNLRLTNSYLERSGQYQNNNFIGSIAGDIRGKVDTVYSDAIIVSDGKQVGGLFGRLNSIKVTTEHIPSSVNNCWFNGEIILKGEEGRFAGGIAGAIVQGTVNISNCLFTGSISAEASAGLNVGGIIGLELANAGIVINITDCLAAGIIKHENCYTRVGTFIGGMNAKTSTYTLKHCYTLKGVCVDGANNDLPYGLPTSAVKNGFILSQDKELLTGMNGYRFTELDFKKYWSVSDKGVPVLKSFASKSPSVVGVKRMMDTSWYSPDKKVLTIDSVADFYGFAELSKYTNFEGQTIKLATDIVFNTGDASTWGEKAPTYKWIPIGNGKSFLGNFDGQGHTISGLYVKDTSEKNSYTGMFGIIGTGSTVKNFRLTNSYFERTGHKDNYAFIGSVAGDLRGTLDTVYSDAIVKTDGIQAAGLVARANGIKDKDGNLTTVKINNCWFDGDLILTGTNGRYAGGIVGAVIQGTADISNCLFTGYISVEKEDEGLMVGGILGIDWGICEVNISDCLSAGEIDVVRHVGVGSIIGRFRQAKTKCTITDTFATKACYRMTVGSPTSSVPEGDVYAMEEGLLTGIGGYQNTTLDFEKYWAVVETRTPELKSFTSGALNTNGVAKLFDTSWYSEDAKELTIDSVADLYGFYYLSLTRNFAGQTIKVTKDIDVNPGWKASATAPSNVWKAIGSSSLPFAGTFDGQGHTISGLYLKETTTSTAYNGFFGVTATGSTLKNFKLTNSYFERTADKNGYAFLGSVAGEVRGTVDTVYSDATVVTDGQMAGGIAGRLNGAKVNGALTSATINNCWYEGEMKLSKATGRHAAGIVGVAVQGNVNIINCLFTGSITSDHTAAVNVGGILGIHWTANATVSLYDCLSAGTISVSGVGNSSMVGSVVGGTAGAGVYYIERAYGSSATATQAFGKYNSNTVLNGMPVNRDDLTGYFAYMYTDLDFVDTWVARTDEVPALQSFYEGEVLDVTNALKMDLSWYTEGTSPYVIDSVGDLYGFAYLVNEGMELFSGKTVTLGADIDIASFNNNWKESGENTTAPTYTWTPIGSDATNYFKGTFDGKGHTISGVYVYNDKDLECFGLFGRVPGQLKNFKLENSYIYSNYWTVGSIAGQLTGNISNVYSDAYVVAKQNVCGGLIGRILTATTSSISNSWFAGTVSAKQYVGGIVGRVHGGTKSIVNCLNTGTVKTTYTNSNVNGVAYVGGIVGGVTTAGTTLTLEGCISAGAVATDWTSGVGTVVGRAEMPVTVKNTYTCATQNPKWSTDNTVTGFGKNSALNNTITGAAIQLSVDELKGTNAYKNTELDFYSKDNTDGVWAAIADKTPELKTLTKEAVIDNFDGIERVITSWYYGAGSGVTKYEITTLSELYGLRELVNNAVDDFDGKTITLKADILINEGKATDWADDKNVSSLVKWTPIGTKDNVFKGTFDGGNHTVSGLYLLRGQYSGVFGAVSGATVMNLRIENSYFGTNMSDAYNYAYLGSVIGQGSGTLKNIYSDAIVESRQAYVGGLVGLANGDLSMDSCWFDGTINVSEIGVALESGGFVGRVGSGTTSFNTCLYTGDLFAQYTSTLTTQTTYGPSIGALAGRVAGSVNVTNSLVVGTVDVKWIESAATNPAGITYVGPIVGRINTATNASGSNVYALTVITTKILDKDTVTVGAAGVGTNVGTSLTIDTSLHGRADELMGANGKTLLPNLDFVKDADESIWIARENAIPAPKALVNDGTKIDTSWYKKGATTNVIDSKEDLLGFAMLSAEGETFSGDVITLGADITLNEGDAEKWAKGEEISGLGLWTPIGRKVAFAGTFDGNNKTISGVYVNITDNSERVGFFAYVGTTGTVKNLRLTNSYIYYSFWETGSVIGDLHGNAENIYSDAIVYSKGSRVGGIVGRMHNTTTASVKNCWFAGTVTGTVQSIGGIVGSIQNGAKTVENCLNTGTVVSTRTSTNPAVGGIVGNIEGVTSGKEHQIKYCLNAGEVVASGTNRIGAILGFTNKAVTLTNLYTTNKITLNSGASLGTVTMTGVGSGSSNVNGTTPSIVTFPADLDSTCTGLNAGGTNWEIRNETLVLTQFQNAH